MPRPGEDKVPWAAIKHAVAAIINDTSASLKKMEGASWSVYRAGTVIRIDIKEQH